MVLNITNGRSFRRGPEWVLAHPESRSFRRVLNISNGSYSRPLLKFTTMARFGYFHKISENRGGPATSPRFLIWNPNRGWGCPIFVIILPLSSVTCFPPAFWPILIRD